MIMTEQIRSPRLPANGIFTATGHYFHHTFAKPLTSDEKQALIDNGIDYAGSKRFTETEDIVIRANWEQFAKANDIVVEHVVVVARMASMVRSGKRHKDEFAHVNFHNFFPAICKGLPNRSAYQVLWRMRYIHDPAFVSGQDKIVYNTISRDLVLPKKQLEKIDRMVAKRFPWAKITEDVGCSLNRCVREYKRWLVANNQIPRKLWIKLWENLECESEVDDGDDFDKTTVFKTIRNYCFAKQSDPETVESIIGSMDIASQAKDLDKTEKTVRNTWVVILEKLRKSLRHERRKFPSSSDDILFLRAVNENIKFAFLVTFGQLIEFLKILIQYTKDDTICAAFASKLYHIPKVEAIMKRRGVTSFYCGNDSEFMYLFQTVYNILFRCNTTIYSLFRTKYSVKERLSILLECFELQWQHLHAGQDRNTTQQLDFSEFNEKTKITRKKYIYVKTSYFLDVLVAFTVKRDPKWIPPTKLFKYMIRPETKALFHDKVDNSQLLLKRS